MTKKERYPIVLSQECRIGNHQECHGKLDSTSGVDYCQCTHHQNTPVYVDDTPVSKENVM